MQRWPYLFVEVLAYKARVKDTYVALKKLYSGDVYASLFISLNQVQMISRTHTVKCLLTMTRPPTTSKS